jgi:hypothetical protein
MLRVTRSNLDTGLLETLQCWLYRLRCDVTRTSRCEAGDLEALLRSHWEEDLAQNE